MTLGTCRSKGFAVGEIQPSGEAQEAITGLNGPDFHQPILIAMNCVLVKSAVSVIKVATDQVSEVTRMEHQSVVDTIPCRTHTGVALRG